MLSDNLQELYYSVLSLEKDSNLDATWDYLKTPRVLPSYLAPVPVEQAISKCITSLIIGKGISYDLLVDERFFIPRTRASNQSHDKIFSKLLYTCSNKIELEKFHINAPYCVSNFWQTGSEHSLEIIPRDLWGKVFLYKGEEKFMKNSEIISVPLKWRDYLKGWCFVGGHHFIGGEYNYSSQEDIRKIRIRFAPICRRYGIHLDSLIRGTGVILTP